ncbi:sulfurtransferase [Halomonas sp. LS-001]
MNRTIISLAAIFSFATQAQAHEMTPLVDASWLNEHLDADNLVVLDVRSSIDDGGDADSFRAERIPGSRYSSYTEAGWRETRDDVPGLMPAVDALETLIGGLGIGNDSQVVIVPAGTGATDFGSAARVYWTFRMLGHEDVAILDGGFAGWQQQGFDVVSGEPAKPEGVDFSASLQEALFASSEDVKAAIDSPTQLVDARPAGFYTADTQSSATLAAGTIPTAVNLEHQKYISERDGAYYLEETPLLERIDELGLDADTPTIAFCNTGHWAAIGWFMLQEVAGFENTSMYDGSMAEWTRQNELPLQVAGGSVTTVGEQVN